jgi:hypothetical protein
MIWSISALQIMATASRNLLLVRLIRLVLAGDVTITLGQRLLG